MTTAFALLGYAVAAAWLAPTLLAPLTGSGASVRPALAAWLSAMTGVVLSAALGTALIAATATESLPALAQVLCRGVAGTACTPRMYRGALYSAGVAVLAVLVTVAALAALGRYGHRARRSSAQTRRHARAALLAGRALAGTGAVVLEDPRPVAYCVAGRPAAIVVTSGALAVLDDAQLAAVLAHERAHLAGRHHLLATITRGLAAAFPRVPLFLRGSEETARLSEMAADDQAVRSAGRPALVAALVSLATGTAVPGAAIAVMAPIGRPGLAAAGRAVPARVERLLRPPGSAAAARSSLVLTLASAALILIPAALAATVG